MSSNGRDAEDILSESLEFLGGQPVIDDNIIRYGPLVLSLPPKRFQKANTLLADHLFSPALFLAERIERGLLNVGRKTVIELGAGSALPSLLLSTQPDPPSVVVITDYPDNGIMGNLRKNIERNNALVTKGCIVQCESYDWGKDPVKLLELTNSPLPGYDVVILSDLLHFFDSHDVLIASVIMLLTKKKEARVYVGAGKYTHADVCNNFLVKSESVGIRFEEISDEEGEGKWLGTLSVSNLDHEALVLRKNNCRYWVGRWSDLENLP
ncbi:hypothetical protein CPB84DRAFT_1678048 [Gymnopilus junonius]|uniref:Uncharacterized protein n=1 Tax=Gymnopilus junonius TaxID=109634 RepID=A0A9P5TNI8_GYMJU|nr:hypothetical protein CPB84DRAFT_1678048 [Gymnopilus junonius]